MPPKMVPNRYGTVVKFRAGITEQEIVKAMNLLRPYLEHIPVRWSDVVRKYDDAWGEPVWYIP